MSVNSLFHAAAKLNTMRGVAMAAWTPYIGLCISDPQAGGGEFDGTIAPGYARVLLAFNAPSNWAVVSQGAVFPTPGDVWPAAAFIGIWDAASAGNLRLSWPTSGAPEDLTGTPAKPVQLPAGAVTIVEP